MKKPKAPKKTAQEVAVERRQTIMLDKEIEEQEDRFRALSRGKLGRASLLAGAPRTRGEAAGRGGMGGGTRGTTAGGMTGTGGMAGTHLHNPLAGVTFLIFYSCLIIFIIIVTEIGIDANAFKGGYQFKIAYHGAITCSHDRGDYKCQ